MNSQLRVGPKRIISIRYTMRNSAGDILVNTFSGEPVKFIFGSGEIIPELEEPLQGLRTGENKTFTLSPKGAASLHEAYHFDVKVEGIEWAREDSVTVGTIAKGDCGPDCDC